MTTLRVLIHAASADALDRARNNALNLRRDMPGAEVRIIANAQAVARALDVERPECDSYTHLCPNTLKGMGLDYKPPFQRLESGAITEIVRLQQAGWLYVHA